jgi:sulfur-carrier protein
VQLRRFAPFDVAAPPLVEYHRRCRQFQVTAMPRVVFAPHVLRHVDCPPSEQPGRTVRECLDAVFDRCPVVRGYILDDQGSLRKHVAVFINDRMVADRDRLSDPVENASEIFVFQALSGG